MTTVNKTTSAVVISDYHRDIYAAAQSGQRATQTMAKKMEALLEAQYGSTSPTFEQYRADQKALAQIAKSRKLADNQWVRKPYAAAVKAKYGQLPVSLDPAAVLKAAKRAADAAAAKAAGATATAGAAKGETQDHGTSDAENIDSVVTRLGLFAVLEACTRILAADDLTKAQAVHIGKMAHKAAEIVAKKAA